MQGAAAAVHELHTCAYQQGNNADLLHQMPVVREQKFFGQIKNEKGL